MKSKKNYLFAPFKNDDDKIESFNRLKNNLVDINNNDPYELIIFMGRLESYYDVIISKLQSTLDFTVEILDESDKERDELKADNKHDADVSYELDDKHIEIIKELEEKNKRLQSHVDKYGSIRHGELVESNKRLQSKVDELKAELKTSSDGINDLNDVLKDMQNESIEQIKENKELKAEVKRGEEQYHMLASSKTSHYPKEYQAEADEWFEHNPQDEKLFFFMVGGSGVDEDGDVINTLNVGADAIAECDNFKGVVSVETYD